MFPGYIFTAGSLTIPRNTSNVHWSFASFTTCAFCGARSLRRTEIFTAKSMTLPVPKNFTNAQQTHTKMQKSTYRPRSLTKSGPHFTSCVAILLERVHYWRNLSVLVKNKVIDPVLTPQRYVSFRCS